MTRPIGPMERLALDAAEKVEAARTAVLALRESFPRTDGNEDAYKIVLDGTREAFASPFVAIDEATLAAAREADDAAETWLVWEWDRRAKAWVAQIDPQGAQYRVEVYPRDLLGTAECDPEGPGPWQAAIFTAVFGNMVPCASADEGKALCEDHARQRGQFATEDET